MPVVELMMVGGTIVLLGNVLIDIKDQKLWTLVFSIGVALSLGSFVVAVAIAQGS